jgi:hypothetical protein
MIRRYAAAVLAIIGVSVVCVRADDVWTNKDWRQWSKDEVRVVLHDSPWCKRWAKGEATTSAALPSVSGAGKEGAAGEDRPELDYYLQIRSALPVREAVIRDVQIQNGYDTMPAAQKKSFDDQATPFLDRRYDDVIVVHVLYSSNIQAFERQLAEYWQNIPPEKIPEELFLINEREQRIAPIRFTSKKGGAYEFDLAFPRTVNGDPIIHDTDKIFNIQFHNPAVGTQATNAPSSGPTINTGGATTEKKQGSTARIPMPSTGGASPNPKNPAVANFKAERALVQFNVESMMWKGKLTY